MFEECLGEASKCCIYIVVLTFFSAAVTGEVRDTDYIHFILKIDWFDALEILCLN